MFHFNWKEKKRKKEGHFIYSKLNLQPSYETVLRKYVTGLTQIDPLGMGVQDGSHLS